MDYPYLFFYILLILLAFLYWRTGQVRFAKWAFVISFVFFAFRAPVVGADTWDYVRYLTGERNFYNYDPRPLEPLFVLYREILCHITNSRFIVMVINTIVTFAPLYYMTKKYSQNPPLTILFFCFLGGMSIYFIGLRQIIALSILYLALIVWLQSGYRLTIKICLYVICTIIAFYFHTSSVLYALIVIISLIPFPMNRITYFFLIIGSVLVGIVFAKFDVLNFFSILLQFEFSSVERLGGYLENDELNELNSLTLLLRLSIFAIVTYFYIDKEKLSHPFSKIFLVEVIMYNLLHSVPMVHRLCNPLCFFGAIVFSWILDKKSRRSISYRYLNIVITIIVAYFLRSQIIDLSTWEKSQEGRMHPYYFVFEDYSRHPSITEF